MVTYVVPVQYRCDAVGAVHVRKAAVRRRESDRDRRPAGERRASSAAVHLHHRRLHDHDQM